MRTFTKIMNGLTVLVLALVLSSSSAFAATSVVYDAMPSTLPPNMASLGYQATQTSEFGDYVHLAGTNRTLATVKVVMSDWALYSDYASTEPYASNSTSWTHPITVKVYSGHLTDGVPDQLLASKTETVTIPWRPAADPTCPGGTAWRAGDNQCYNGLAFNASFDFSSMNVTLPNDVIVSIAYDTQTYGTQPLGVNGPYNSLNVGLVGAATVGTDDNTDNVFWNTSTAAWYTDGGAGGVGIFRTDTNWTPYGTLPMQISTAIPMPTDKDQCKKDGWKTFGEFKNQGDCVSFVVTKGKN